MRGPGRFRCCKITTFPQTCKGLGIFSLFTDAPAAMSCPPFNPPPFGHPLKRGKGGHLWLRQNSAAMSSPRWHVRWLGIYGCGLFRAFFLIRKHERIKADIKGLPHLATAPPPCRPGPRAQPGRSLALPHITNYLSDNKRLQSTTNV